MLAPGRAGAGEKRQPGMGVPAAWPDRLLKNEVSLGGSIREFERLRPDWTGLGWSHSRFQINWDWPGMAHTATSQVD